MNNLKGRDLKGIADFSREEIECTLEVSRLLKLELKMGGPHRLLEGKTPGGHLRDALDPHEHLLRDRHDPAGRPHDLPERAPHVGRRWRRRRTGPTRS